MVAGDVAGGLGGGGQRQAHRGRTALNQLRTPQTSGHLRHYPPTETATFTLSNKAKPNRYLARQEDQNRALLTDPWVSSGWAGLGGGRRG